VWEFQKPQIIIDQVLGKNKNKSECMHFSLVYKSKVKEKKGKSSTQQN
jgi:hypothetical protein